MRRALRLLPLLVLLGSCKSPPKPPTVDESTKRPLNATALVQLQACRGDLQNTRILMNESVRSAEAARTVAAQAEQRRVAAENAASALEYRNVVYSIVFGFGSARIGLLDASAAAVVAEARTAPMILVRGRTDGTTSSPAEIRMAQARSGAVQAWLVAAGVPPARIRATWQPVGDHAADNDLPDGRALNRRVEIEIYRAAPEVVALNQPRDAVANRLPKRLTSIRGEDDHER